MERLVEVRDAGQMGLGLFAKENIPRGARILAEVPLLQMPRDHPIRLPYRAEDHLSDGCSPEQWYYEMEVGEWVEEVAVRGLHSEAIKAMGALYCNEEEAQDEEIKGIIKEYLFELVAPECHMSPIEFCQHYGLPERVVLDEEIQDYATDHYTRLHAIWANNRVKYGSGTIFDSGIFPLASRINHSCCPNAWYDYNPDVGNKQPRVEMLTTHAIRDIAAGEQILVGYDAVSLKPRRQRLRKLTTWDIYNCVCALCTDPLVEALQERACLLWQTVNTSLRAWQWPVAYMPVEGLTLCKDGFEALKMGEEVIALLTHPSWNVREMALAEAYVKIFSSSNNNTPFPFPSLGSDNQMD